MPSRRGRLGLQRIIWIASSCFSHSISPRLFLYILLNHGLPKSVIWPPESRFLSDYWGFFRFFKDFSEFLAAFECSCELILRVWTFYEIFIDISVVFLRFLKFSAKPLAFPKNFIKFIWNSFGLLRSSFGILGFNTIMIKPAIALLPLSQKVFYGVSLKH